MEQLVDLDAVDVMLNEEDLSDWDVDDAATAVGLTAFTGICMERIDIDIPDGTSRAVGHYQQPFGTAYTAVSARVGVIGLDNFFAQLREALARCEGQEIGGADGQITDFEQLGDETLAYSFDRTADLESLWVGVRKADVFITVRHVGVDGANYLFVEQSLKEMLDRIPEGREMLLTQVDIGADDSVDVEVSGGEVASDDSTGGDTAAGAATGVSEVVFNRHSAPVVDLVELPDGRVVSVDEESVAWIWDPSDPRNSPVLMRVPGTDQEGAFVGGFTAVTALPDGRVVTAGMDCSDTDPASCSRPQDVLHFWDPEQPDQMLSSYREHDSTVQSMNVLSDGRLVVGSRKLWILDPADLAAEPLKFSPDYAGSTVQLNDGRLATSGRVSAIWDIRTAERIDVNPITTADTVFEYYSSTTSLVPLPGGRMASGMQNGWVNVWQIEDPAAEPLVYTRQDGDIIDLVVLDENHIASASLDGTVHIWNPNVEQREPLATHESHLGPVNAMIQLSSGLLATASEDGDVRVWDPAELVGPLDPGSVADLAVDAEAVAVLPEPPEVMEIIIDFENEPLAIEETAPIAISPILSTDDGETSFGQVVSLSGDTLAVAAPAGPDGGRVEIFARGGDEWANSAAVVGPIDGPEAQFATSLSLDGKTLVVGAEGTDDSEQGRVVHVFEAASTGDWELAESLKADVGEDGLDYGFGESAILVDGVLVAATSPVRSRANQGRTLVYEPSADGWQESFRLPTTKDEAAYDYRDGRLATAASGKVEIYEKVGEDWFEVAEIRFEAGAGGDLVKLGDGFVAVADGRWLWVVWLDDEMKGTVQQLVAKPTLSSGLGRPALAVDGELLVYKKSGQGEIRVYERSGTEWIGSAMITTDWTGRNVGDSIDLDDGYLVLAAPEESVVLGGPIHSSANG